MNNFIPQYEPLIKPKHWKAIRDQMKTGWVGPSKTTEKFEDRICEITGSSNCISVTSGTAALIVAIEAIKDKMSPNRESTILFPNYTFLAGANAAKFLGFNIKLIDIDPYTLCMDPKIARKKVKDNDVCAVIFVNHNGYSGMDVRFIKDACEENGVPMIEDSSQALGIPDAGIVGDIGIFSFSVPKIVTTGQGGALITDSNQLASKARKIRDQGGENWKKTRIHDEIGVNFKFNDILSAYGLSQLEDIDEILAKRKKIWDWYRNDIEIADYGYRDSSTWMVLYLSDNVDLIIEKLRDNNIHACKYYKPINWNPSFGGENKGEFPVSEEIYRKLVYLPSSLTLKRKDVKRITKIIREIDK